MINNITKNFKPGEFILLAGRPDSGKTVLAAEMAEYMVVREKEDVLFFSLQHEKQNLIDKYFENHSEEKLIIDDTPGISITEVRNKFSQFARKRKITWIFIDYLPLMSGSESCNSRVGELQEIIRGLRALAQEAGVVIVATAPLSRHLNSRPTIQDLRDYGLDLGKEVDLVALVWNEGCEKEIAFIDPKSDAGEIVLYKYENRFEIKRRLLQEDALLDDERRWREGSYH